VAVACSLRPGLELDRAALRRLRGELRRVEALEAAARALRHRDLAAARVDAALERRRIAPAERQRAIGALERAGLVDDRRVAKTRAAALAQRGYGDEAIRWRLAQEGIPDEPAEEALAALEPERERVERLLEREGRSARTVRLLARRGFSEDALELAAWQSEGRTLG
jgi:SOS response regulatory protein OraA/RecX